MKLLVLSLIPPHIPTLLRVCIMAVLLRPMDRAGTKNFTIVVVNNAAGYFAVNGMTYFPALCDSSYPTVIRAYLSADSLNGKQMAFGFNPSLPLSSGYYGVSSSAYLWGVRTDQLDVDFLPNGGNTNLIYHSSGGNGTQQVYVTVMANRRLNLVGSNIEMVNLNTPYDSFPISFNITMTQ